MTYEGRGVSKTGVTKSDHAVVHTGKQPPSLFDNEMPARDEEPVRAIPIRVKPSDPTDKLSNAARINFGKVYKIEQSIEVKRWGFVVDQSMSALRTQFRTVALRKGSTISTLPTPGSSSPTIRPGQDEASDEVV